MNTESKEIISQEQLEAEIRETIEQHKDLVISDDAGFVTAQEALKMIKDRAKKVKEWFAPMVKKAFEAHKEIKAKENELIKPLAEIGTNIAQKCGAYQMEAEEKARKERAAKEKKLREEAEEKRLAEAAELEEAGKTEEADAVLDEPVDVAPPPVEAPPKVKGLSYRLDWKFEIENREKIQRDFMMPDEKKIGGFVRSMKELAVGRIGGVRVYSVKTPVSR